ncbi:MAG: NUDIX hydrolase [Anaerolineae bacterium]|nr:NUDIX hydrolase [Anaerolineae bacterium]
MDVKSQHEVDPSGIEAAIARFGKPEERDYCLSVRCDTYEEHRRKRGKRAAEVVFLVCRPGGKFLLHTKSFYPPGAYRVLTGGIEEGEDLVAAICREAREETGLEVSVERFL